MSLFTWCGTSLSSRGCGGAEPAWLRREGGVGVLTQALWPPLGWSGAPRGVGSDRRQGFGKTLLHYKRGTRGSGDRTSSAFRRTCCVHSSPVTQMAGPGTAFTRDCFRCRVQPSPPKPLKHCAWVLTHPEPHRPACLGLSAQARLPNLASSGKLREKVGVNAKSFSNKSNLF